MTSPKVLPSQERTGAARMSDPPDRSRKESARGRSGAPASAVPKNPQRDRCDCLPSTVRCAHFEGVRLILDERILESKCEDCRPALAELPPYYVVIGASPGKCASGNCMTYWDGEPRGNDADFRDLASAQAEFDKRAKLLREGASG